MIDSRTDIVQYYSRWLENRFNEGFLYVRNPAYPTKVQKIILDHEHIDAIIFTSKNYEPGLEFIKKLIKNILVCINILLLDMKKILNQVFLI